MIYQDLDYAKFIYEYLMEWGDLGVMGQMSSGFGPYGWEGGSPCY